MSSIDSSELLKNLKNKKKSDLIIIIEKLVKRCNKEEKPKVYAKKSGKKKTFCGLEENRDKKDKNIKKSNSYDCLRKGFGAGSNTGRTKGVNEERKSILGLLKKHLK